MGVLLLPIVFFSTFNNIRTMLDTSDITALVALVISLIALVVTATQLSAQLFSTAEGTRKCSKSVLGPWSNSRKPDTRTRWNWRWSEGRYETLYVAPELSLSSSFTWYPPPGSTNTKETGLVLKDSVKDTFDQLAQNVKRTRWKLIPDAVLGGDDDLDNLLFQEEYRRHGTDKVGWIDFLTFLRLEIDHQAEGEVVDGRKWTWNAAKRKEGPRTMQNSQCSWPKIKYVQHSWDFVPPDCPKPLASSTVGDIAVLVRRTGMVWKEFKPGEGRMTAEGGSHVINSMEIRGLGIVLQYRCLDDTLNHNVRESRKQRETKKKSMNTTSQGNSQDTQEGGNLRKRLSKQNPQELLQTKDEETGRDDCDDMRKEDVAINNRIKERFRGFLLGMRSEEDGEGEEATDELNENVTRWSPSKSMNPNQDKMMFGLIPSDPALNIPDFPHVTPKECSDVLFDLIRDNEMRDFVEKYGRDDFNDLLYLAPEAFRQRGKERYILQDREHLESVFYDSVHVMAETVKKYLNGEMHAEKAQKLPVEKLRPTQIGSDLKEYFSWIFDSLASKTLDLDEIQSHHEDTTMFFRNLETKHHLRFQDVLAAHFFMTTGASCQIRKQQKKEDHDHDKYGEDWEMRKRDKHRFRWEYVEDWKYRRQILEFCFCDVNDYTDPKFSVWEVYPLCSYWQDPISTSTEKGKHWEEAWIMLMLRGFLYRELHDFPNEFVDQEYLDRKYYKSNIPVWLG